MSYKRKENYETSMLGVVVSLVIAAVLIIVNLIIQ
jgi:hypothetical protein